MINLSKRAQLGLYVLVELSRAHGEQRSNEELARTLGVSVNHLAKVMQALARAGWVVGSRGVGGGYRMTADAKIISMADVLAVFEGATNLETCAIARDAPCAKHDRCTIHGVIREIEEQAYFTLQSVTLHMLAHRSGARQAGLRP